MIKRKEKTTRVNTGESKVFFWKVSLGRKILKAYVETCKYNSLPQNNLSSVLFE